MSTDNISVPIEENPDELNKTQIENEQESEPLVT